MTIKKVSYYFIAIGAIGIAIVAFWTYDRYFKKEKPAILTYQVQRGNIEEAIKVRGEVVPETEFDLGFTFSGIVDRIFVKEGDSVAMGASLIKLDTTDLGLELKRLEALLTQSRSNLEKLQAGATLEDIRVLETAVENSRVAFSDAEANLEKVKNKANADLKSVYDAALTALEKTVNAARNSLYTLTDIQFSHFAATNQDSINIANGKAEAVLALLGGTDGGRALSSAISNLNGGAFGSVGEALADPSYTNIDRALSVTLSALHKVKSALYAVPLITDLTATEKTNLSSEKTTINTEIANISAKEQAISVQKASNLSSVKTAETNVNNAKSALGLAESNLNFKKAGARKEDIDIAKAQVEEIQSQVGAAQDRLKKAVIKAPAPAKVTKIWLEKGELYQLGQVAVSLSTSGHKIQSDVSELEIGKVRETDGNDVVIKLDAFPGTEFVGKILSVEPQEILKEGDKYYTVNIYLELHGEKVRSGMSADVIIKISSKKNIIKVPEYMLEKSDEKTTVKISDNGRMSEAEVTTGISDGEFIEITGGLIEGQTIVTAGE